MTEPRRIVPDGGIRAGYNTDAVVIPPCRIIKQDTVSTIPEAVLLSVDATHEPVGVSMESIAIGITGDVQKTGKAIVESGAAWNKGDRIGSDGSGRGIAITATGSFQIGLAVDAAAGAGEFHEVELF